MKKYGLQLRAPVQQKKPQNATVGRPPLLFQDDEDNDVEKEISRQASKQKSLRDVEAQHKKALEEDPTVFDYDGVYDEMKEKIARPIVQDRQKREVKYVHALLKTAKTREKEQDIVYERNLAKERSKEDHLYEDKEKFVTSAYKKKLAEQEKWLAEERLRELREEKDDVTKKDITDFYFNLHKNVAFGAKLSKADDFSLRKPQEATDERSEVPQRENTGIDAQATVPLQKVHEDQAETPTATQPGGSSIATSPPAVPSQMVDAGHASTSDAVIHERHKRSEDALAAAKERYLARKKAKEL